jgi:hypothetical protein
MTRSWPSDHGGFDRVLQARARRAADEHVGDNAGERVGVHVHGIPGDLNAASHGGADVATPEPSLRYAEDGADEEMPAAAPTLLEATIDVVAKELRLTDLGPEELGRIRRDFARSNHPDCVAPALRALATRRMMLANVLIDQALLARKSRPA